MSRNGKTKVRKRFGTNVPISATMSRPLSAGWGQINRNYGAGKINSNFFNFKILRIFIFLGYSTINVGHS